MSQLVFSETGRFWPTYGEELTERRRARKVLVAPATAQAATLYVLGRPHSMASPPLLVSASGGPPAQIAPCGPYWSWLTLEVPARDLRPGRNTFELWSPSDAMNGWSLALELGHPGPGSYLSRDGGTSWQNDHMGFADLAPGEYGVRIRVREGSDPAPVPLVWESDSASLARLADLLPREVVRPGAVQDVVRRLSSWVSAQGFYCNTSPVPAPWDPATILAWGRSRRGYGGLRPTVHCVHYAIGFALFCQALDIPARCSALIGAADPSDEAESGHFVAEVWLEDLQRWIMVDPTLDGTAQDGDVPLSIAEVQQDPERLPELINWGPGHGRQMRNPALSRWVDSVFLGGRWLRYRAVWPRLDVLSRPELTAASHGLMPYSETTLVWEDRALEAGFGMFPLFGDRSYFDAPPVGFPRRGS